MTDWKHKINLSDVFHNDELSFGERRNAIVDRIRRSLWFKSKDESDELPQFIEELSETHNEDDFDNVWSSIYDEADADKVWITTT